MSIPATVVPTRLCSVVLGQAALMVMCTYRAYSEHLGVGLCEDVSGSQRNLDADQLHAFGEHCSIITICLFNTAMENHHFSIFFHR